ncbi:MAG TPA: aminomethyl-transferring glycine dehydrogenase subunit GcvPA [Anaerolineales bacterium]|nr:aminomethyl-transferring glycine dehydrogenase subunit GcvPA [Anaerolineales bacterium]
MFIPHTDADREAMLSTIGVERMQDLFKDVPAGHRFPELALPPAMTEMEILAELQDLAWANSSARELSCFLGAGVYNHYIPAAVDSILRRSEFYTAYTPYQPEVSQGTLQAIFEYQSLIAGLTGMEVCNASHYDGATAAAEAVNMAYHHFRGKRNKVILSPGLHPQYRETIRTYTDGSPIALVGDHGEIDLLAGPDGLTPLIDHDTALVVVAYPDFFGRVFDLTRLVEAAHRAGALVSVSTYPTALGLLKPPGEFGADIVTGEGQPLGIPLSYGGPYLGLFATRNEYVRKMAGRLVGETVDNRGQRAYVLTLTAREQHIRRERATSNICTNQGLMALAATVYVSLLGRHGMRQVAELCYHKAHYAASCIAGIPGYRLWSQDPFFNEFVVRCPQPVDEITAHLLEHGILGGYDLGQDYPQFKDHLLIAVTEMNSRAEIDVLCDVLEEVSNG